MLIFKCELSHNELANLQNNLTPDQYYIINKPGETTYYGALDDSLHSKFIDILSGETLEQLEYLDEEEFKKISVLLGEDKNVLGKKMI